MRVTYPDRGPLTPADGRVSPVPERATWEFLRRSVGARFGVASRFQLQSDSILEIDAHLFEQRGAGFETLDTWERSCAAPDYAETAFELLCDLARRVGARRATGGWTATFGTGDAEAALTFLRALGGLSLVDWGLPQHGEAALDRLVDALALDPTMAPAIAHLPEHFVLVRDRGGVSPFILARAYRRAVEIVGGVPEAWAGVDNQLRAGSVPAEGS
ncbi:MAG: hypothetical protein H6721_30770 [Sandaracinus sp.]|nr:hypothetical protein [Sandaracinus sp.]